MKIVSFIEEKSVIEKILRHCKLWREYIPRPPPTKNCVAFGGPKQEQGALPIANAGPLLNYSFLKQNCA